MAFIVFQRGDRAGLRIRLEQFPVSIGRDPGNQVIVPDQEASRHHITIRKRGRLFIVDDLQSRNGTYLNGEKILNSTLANGDKLLLGSTELMFLAPETEINLHTSVDFAMEEALHPGLQGPIDITLKGSDPGLKPSRFDPNQLTAGTPEDPQALRRIFEFHSNLVMTDDFNEAARSLLKSLGKMIPSATRGALFHWLPDNRNLVPVATMDYDGTRPFRIIRQILASAVSRRQVVHLARTEGVDRHRLILPMFLQKETIAIAYLESDRPGKAFSMREIEYGQILLHRAAHVFETLILRKELDSWLLGMLEAMIATVEAKDTYTRGHSERVSRYCMAIADQLKLNREVKRLLMISALCHDIGKVGIPDNILKKASHLSAEEYEEMKLHPTMGAEIVKHMPNHERFISGVKYHHEKWDGSGYPEGLAGEDIPFFGRIVGIADVFDAMVSGRAYSGFLGQAEAVEKLAEEKELFDPAIFDAFTKAYDNGILTLKTSTQSRELPKEDHILGEETKVIISDVD